MSNPRNDQTILDRLCEERDAVCPSWWGCLTRGCYELAQERYASSGLRPKLPGDPGYLSTESRTERERDGGGGYMGDLRKRSS